MSEYIVSARKYRPATFDTVVGQRALTATLKNAIATKRLAHSYLFCGSRGVGKTSCARIFAKAINCENPREDGEACNECRSCRQFNEGRSLNIIEMDAASKNSVDDMRALVDQVLVAPTLGKYRVFIIDEVHMLSSAAFNAFLKTLEEPPKHVIFILATTEKHKIIPTILSRCQIYDFNIISIRDMVDHLAYVAGQEGITADPSALGLIARKADGAMRDALSIFDQVAASTLGNITYAATLENLNLLDGAYYSRLVEAFLEERVMDTWLIYKEIRDHGFDSHFFLTGLATFMRDLMTAMSPATRKLLDVPDDEAQAMQTLAAKCQPRFLLSAISILNEADLNFRQASNKQFHVEVTLARLCQLCSPSPDSAGRGEGLKRVEREQPPTVRPTQPAPASSPAPSPVSTPAPVPAAKPKPTPKAAPSVRPGMATTSLKSLLKKDKVEPKTAPADKPEEHRAAFTDEQLQQKWQEWIDAHPQDLLIINTMRAGMPVRAEGNSFTMRVENELQMQMMDENLPTIRQYLRRELGNDSIEICPMVNESTPSAATWTNREVLENILERHPEFSNWITELGLK